jgi:hypothetical protein
MKYTRMSLKLLAGAYLAVSHSVSRLPALLTLKYSEKLSRDKNSSLFCRNVSDQEKESITLTKFLLAWTRRRVSYAREIIMPVKSLK